MSAGSPETKPSWSWLNDPRDRVFVFVALGLSLVFIPAAVFFFTQSGWGWFGPVLYWAGLLACLGPYTLMLHATSHRSLFRKEHQALNHYIPWVLGPFFGQSPGTYFAHHIGMHHPRGNRLEDLSSTLPYRRDHFGDFIQYWLRFLVLGPYELSALFYRAGQWKFLSAVITGEAVFYALAAVSLFFNSRATLVVWVIPFLACRFLLMAGNWAQHAFVDPEKSADYYSNSITLDKTFYNVISFNDGYHTLHHLQPRCHWTEMANVFHRNRAEYLARGTVVFEGLDYFMIWALLMTHQYKVLASRLVPLTEGESLDERVRRLRSRLGPVAAQAPVPASVLAN